MSELRDRNRYWLHDFASGFSDGLRLMLLLAAAWLFLDPLAMNYSYLMLSVIIAAAFLTAAGTYVTLKNEISSTPQERTKREEKIYTSIDLKYENEFPVEEIPERSQHPLITPVASAFRVFIFYIAGGLLIASLSLITVPGDELLLLLISGGLLACFAMGWLRGWVYGTHRLGEAFRFTFYMAAGLLFLYLIAHLVTA
jgi:hypothetical protein